MITIPVLIIFILSVAGVALLFVFKRVNQKSRDAHQKQLREYAKTLQIQKKQLKKRMKSLDTYDLLRYNLSEALLVQDQIML